MVKKICALLLLSCVLMVLSCKSDSDVLAVAGSDQITRGEFRKWLQSRHLPIDSIMKSKGSQKSYLKSMAIEKLTYEKYLGSSRKDDPELMLLENVIYKNFLSSFYIRKLREKIEFTETCDDISIIKLPFENNVKSNKNEKVTKVQDSRKIMLEVILPRLAKGESFEKLAKEFSVDFSKKNGGHIGYISGKMMGEEVFSVVSGLKTGEYSSRPVKIRNGLYLIKVNKRTEISNSNIDKVVADVRNRNSLKNYLINRKVNEYIASLEKKFTVVAKFENSGYSKDGEVLFKINDEVFKNSDLKSIVAMFYKLRFGYVPKNDVEKRKKIATVKRIFSERLLCADAVAQGVDKAVDFIKDWESVKTSAISGAYKFSELSSGVTVTQKEILDEYKANVLKKNSGKKPVKTVQLPFSKVKESIKNRLFSRKIANLKRKWDNDMLQNAKFRIAESKLEGK